MAENHQVEAEGEFDKFNGLVDDINKATASRKDKLNATFPAKLDDVIKAYLAEWEPIEKQKGVEMTDDQNKNAQDLNVKFEKVALQRMKSATARSCWL